MEQKIKCIIWGGNEIRVMNMNAKEIVSERQRFKNAAAQALKECDDPDIRHMIYYRDERRADDSIWTAHFYENLIGLNDDDFYARVEESQLQYGDCGNGFIGAVHRH